MLCTRPDLAYTISQISQYSTHPSTIHEMAAKRSLRYLNGTRDLGICYDGSNGLILEGYSDADWGAGEDRRSISGFLFLPCGGVITYSAKKQTSTALSTTEAKYAALVQAAKAVLAVERTQIRSDPIPGPSVATSGASQVEIAATRSESGSDQSG